MTNLAQVFLKIRDRDPNQIAIRFRRLTHWTDLTWGQYYQLIEQLAAGLMVLGAKSGDRLQDVRTKYLQSSSGNRALSGFTGDNRDQRAFAFWSALWAGACLQVAKPGAPGLFFTDWRQLPVSTDYLQSGGWVWRGIVPWVKTNARPQMGRFKAECEFVVWGSAGAMPVERDVGCLAGFYRYPPPLERDHVTEKPEELLVDMLQVVPVGSLVLDPFMGSGTTGAAAVRTGRKFVGIELDRGHFDFACKRIEDSMRQAPLIAHG
jgi:site-specific DNA-methyltransferase (adenine-specific)